jgi:hypothetical protein
MPILICPECGTENPLAAERCQKCGFSLMDVTPSPSIEPEEPGQDDMDLFPQEEKHDLPDLLNALKQDGELEPVDAQDERNSNESEEDSSQAGSADKGHDSDWLTRVRQRVHQDEDSMGEITQDIEHAQEEAEGQAENLSRPDFDSWLQRLRDQARDEAAGKDAQGDLHSGRHDDAGDDSDWLSKVRKAHGVLPESEGDEAPNLEDREGDSLLQWLVELEESDEPPMTVTDVEKGSNERPTGMPGMPHPISGKQDFDDTQEVYTGELHFESPKLAVSAEEQTQADQLAAAIVDERASRPAHQHDRRSFGWIVRLVIGIMTIAGLIFSLFFGGKASLPENLLQPQNEALLAWAEGLPADASVLLVFDYTAGYSSEINLIARPVLNSVLQRGVSLSIISSSVSGTLLAGKFIDELEGGDSLEVVDLGYFPTAAYGAYDLAFGGSTFQGQDFDGVMILSDGYDGARVWIEQLSTMMPDVPLGLLVTAQTGPMLLPYWESDQVTGMVSGISEAAGVDAALSGESFIAGYWRAYQVGVFMLIALLVIGLIFTAVRTSDENLRGEA